MFETALPNPKSRNRRRWIAFPAAVALHLTALVAFVSADYWHIRPVAEPEQNALFVMVTPPPPIAAAAPAGSNRPKQPTPVEEPVKPPQGPVQPTDVKDLTPPPVHDSGTAGNDEGTSDQGTEHGSKNGSDEGFDFGSDDGVPNEGPAPVAPAPSGPIHITARVQKPEILHRVSPAYPETARRARVQGAVILEAIIDERGNVTSVRVIHGLPMGLEQSAIQAVSQWKFQPATLEGRPVAVYFNLTVQFEVR
jgi:protein TonB